MLNNTGQKTN